MTPVTRATPSAVFLLAALFTNACATEPPPKPAQLDPSNPAAPESRPLETTAAPPMAPVPPGPAAAMAEPSGDEHAGHHPGSSPGPAAAPAPAASGPAKADEHAGHHPPDGATPHSAASSSAAPIYACPMHPEVTSPKPGKCPKCGMQLEKKPPADSKGHDHEHGAGGAP